MDRDRWSSWWTGLLVPLAYAEDASRLHELTGPLGDHLRPVIDALSQLEGLIYRSRPPAVQVRSVWLGGSVYCFR
jgi:hypothetical protein